MAKTPRDKFATTPEFSTLLENIKSIIRSYQQRRHVGITLPTWMDKAKNKVSAHKRCVSITDSATGKQVLIIHGKWIPLFTRLEAEKFNAEELYELKRILKTGDAPEQISKNIAQWAKELS